MHDFDPTRYTPEVARVLALAGNGCRLIPLTSGDGCPAEARQALKTAGGRDLFPQAFDSAAAMGGLWAYFSCFEQAHGIVSESESRECELWHAILHRQEPDAGNAAYWFRKVGAHPVYPKIAQAAAEVVGRIPRANFGTWDPHAFIELCERARSQPGSADEQAALEIQRVEWQIVFDYCARPHA